MNLLFLRNRNRGLGIGLVLLLTVVLWQQGYSQTTNSFTSLQQPSFAKIAGLGGVNSSQFERGSGFFLYNPALLSATDHNLLAISYGFLPGSAGMTSVNYTFNVPKAGSMGASIQYLSYGPIQGYDDSGFPTTTFTPSNYTMVVSHARQANNIRLGANLKFSNTNINGYNGSALLVDMGAVFIHPEKELNIGLVIKNFGVVLSKFSNTSTSNLPFDIQLGTTFKPLHMPLRFSITLHQLHQWNLMNDGEEINSFNTTLDNVFRHVVIGAELLLKEQFSLIAGYNHMRRKDLRLESSSGISGISLGFALNIKAFEFVYAFGGYHVAGNNNSFTLAANLSEITSK